MAASCSSASAATAPPEPALESLEVKQEADFEDAADAKLGTMVKRNPVLNLLAPISGLQPIVWSQDHRLSASTTSAVSVMELVCDVHSSKMDMTMHRTSIATPDDVLKLKVGPEEEMNAAREALASHSDPAVGQAFVTDRVMNPNVGVHRGIKYTSWSPLGCDSSGRCLLACLTLDHRLTIHKSFKRLAWTTVADLTHIYGERLESRGYSRKDDKPPQDDLYNLQEMQRRYRMQTPIRMEWSSIYIIKQVQEDNTCIESEMLLLAVLMENGDLVLWKFQLPCESQADVTFYDIIESDVDRPIDLAWWEYDNTDADRRMSGLIVGSEVGPVKIMPVRMASVKGYFTLKQPVVLWQEVDEIPVENIKCVPIYHPIRKLNCSLVVATRSCYVFWCLLMISQAGLTVHNAHITGLHTLPIVSLAVTRQGVTVYTCSMDGEIKKLTPSFTESTMFFKQEVVLEPESFPARRMLGITVSYNGALMALASTQAMVDGHHPIDRSYQVNIFTLKTPSQAAAVLLKSSCQNLYRQADLLELVRWKVVRDRCIPSYLQDTIDRKIQETDNLFFWRFRLFLARVLCRALQSASAPWAKSESANIKEEMPVVKKENTDEDVLSVEAKAAVTVAETHLITEHMKKVLGVVYLNIWTAVNTSIPTCGLVEYLSRDEDDRAIKVLIGHIKKKMNKQSFQEFCSLCDKVLPFTDSKQATCENGHMWLRCVLSYQACQNLTFRRCILLDSVARLPGPEEPEWIKKLLKAPCTFCDSPLI